MTVIELMEKYVGLFSRSLLIDLIEFAEYPKDLWTKLDRTFGKHNEDYYRNLESTFRNTRFIYSKLSSSTLSDEFFQDEEEAESSTPSIRIEESLLGVALSTVALEVYEIHDISSSHMDDLEEDIQIYII